jgi:hypothetical protein
LEKLVEEYSLRRSIPGDDIETEFVMDLHRMRRTLVVIDLSEKWLETAEPESFMCKVISPWSELVQRKLRAMQGKFGGSFIRLRSSRNSTSEIYYVSEGSIGPAHVTLATANMLTHRLEKEKWCGATERASIPLPLGTRRATSMDILEVKEEVYKERLSFIKEQVTGLLVGWLHEK